MFFLCTLFIVVEQSSFNKNFEMRVKVKLKLKVKLVGEKWKTWKISRVKVSNFPEVTKFFPDEIFPWRNFSPTFFSPIRYFLNFSERRFLASLYFEHSERKWTAFCYWPWLQNLRTLFFSLSLVPLRNARNKFIGKELNFCHSLSVFEFFQN